jgi:hypothetical protein
MEKARVKIREIVIDREMAPARSLALLMADSAYFGS